MRQVSEEEVRSFRALWGRHDPVRRVPARQVRFGGVLHGRRAERLDGQAWLEALRLLCAGTLPETAAPITWTPKGEPNPVLPSAIDWDQVPHDFGRRPRTAAATERAQKASLERALSLEQPDPQPGAAGIPARLRARRLEQQLSQHELGRRAGLRGQTVQAIEGGGGATCLTVERLAKALDVSPAWLAGWA